jgi:hypothetical protein
MVRAPRFVKAKAKAKASLEHHEILEEMVRDTGFEPVTPTVSR